MGRARHRRKTKCSKTLAIGLFALLGSCIPNAFASMTVLVGEPYGNFGTMMPNGHSAVYLDRVCADGPLRLRMCEPGEPQGVVIARYHQLGPLDWMATPILEFLYASEEPGDVPVSVDKQTAASLREQYRRRYLQSVVPDGSEHAKSTEEWKETAGAAFDRRLWGYQVATSREQDELFVAEVNTWENHHIYHLHKTNCADFTADIVNLYFPGAIRSNRVADFGIMSPKQVAHCLSVYAEVHPALALHVIEVPQVPGTLRRSRPVRGGAEALLKTKRYLAALLVLQPEAPVALEVLYLTGGRWAVGRDAEIVGPEAFAPAAVPVLASTAGDPTEASPATAPDPPPVDPGQQ